MTKKQLRKIVENGGIFELCIDDIYELKNKTLRKKLEKELIRYEYAEQECGYLEGIMDKAEGNIKELLGVEK